MERVEVTWRDRNIVADEVGPPVETDSGVWVASFAAVAIFYAGSREAADWIQRWCLAHYRDVYGGDEGEADG